MSAIPLIKTFPFLKHYKGIKDGKKQVVIRVRIFRQHLAKLTLDKTHDIKLLALDGSLIKVTEAEFRNRKGNEILKFRIPEIESSIIRSINRLTREEKTINSANVFKYTYSPDKETDATSGDMIDNETVQEIYGHPVPAQVWDTLISEYHTDEITGEPVLLDELEDIAVNIESDYYHQKREKELESTDFVERYKNGDYDKNNIFDCFGFCWSNDLKKNEPLIIDSYKSLLLRLYDYRYNGNNPSSRTQDFDDDWIDGFLMFLVSDGYAVTHLKNYTPFNLHKHKITLIKADRKPYRFSAFEKNVKRLKRYIFLMQKYKIIPYSRDVKFISANDYIRRTVNKTGFTRREHSLTTEEFYQLCNKDFKDYTLNTARDMFILAVMGGGFRGEEFYNDKLSIDKRDGEYVLNVYYSKTQTSVTNPVFGQLFDVIERHGGQLPPFLPVDQFRVALTTIAKELQFNRIIISPNTYIHSSNKQVNEVLSDIFSIYFARKTLINILDSLGMSDDDIIEFTGHSKTDTLKHYKGRLSIANKRKVLKNLNIA
jgi:hypothetical protein